MLHLFHVPFGSVVDEVLIAKVVCFAFTFLTQACNFPFYSTSMGVNCLNCWQLLVVGIETFQLGLQLESYNTYFVFLLGVWLMCY